MQWTSPYHEFDELAEEYKRKFSNIYFFGAGNVGKSYADLLQRYEINYEFIDNDEKKQLQPYCGRRVMSLSAYLEKRKSSKESAIIVVCIAVERKEAIEKQLMGEGLKADIDFMYCENYFQKIFPVLLMYLRKCVYIPVAQISLTERCTLRCKKCAHACHLVPQNAPDLSLKVACQSADQFFRFVDYVSEFSLLGGEPFLYKNLAETIDYIGTHYRSHIDIFSITTNGTIIPSDEILSLCKKYKVLMRISNYSAAIPKLEGQYKKLTQLLETHEIAYTLGRKDTLWIDFGFEYVDRRASEDELIHVFDACQTQCREIRGDRFYFCVMARTASENMEKNVGKDDFLDLSRLGADRDKMRFLEYAMGYSEKGYLDMCNYCNGAEAKSHSIPIAEQVGS